MFVENPNDSQLDMYSSPEQYMSERQLHKFDDENSWFNLYYKHVFLKIDETIFKDMYSANFGAPNFPVNVLVGMQQIKEGNGWCDQQLEEALMFNLAVRRALGFMNINDPIPAMSTYYEFRAKVNRYNQEHGRHLMQEAFHDLSRKFVEQLELSGTSIRMDSKLLDSNIANMSRMQTILIRRMQ